MRTADAVAGPERAVAGCALLALAGLLLSGPVGLALVRLHPQPPWSGPEAFAAAYHPIQVVPYLAGFLLVGGALALVAALAALARAGERPRAFAALGFAAAFAALVVFNYVLQTTFVPALARRLTPGSAPLVSALSLSNPTSLGWALEMWGYAVLGVATWLAAPVVRARGRAGRTAATLFVANGPVSLAGGLLTALSPGWVMTPAGLLLFAAWNLLMTVMFTATIAAFGRWPRRARPYVGMRAEDAP